MAGMKAHHGGAWKVAYADFVTAMMALFMVLWLVSQRPDLAEPMAKFFQDPYNTPLDNSMGLLDSEGNGEGNSTEGQARGKTDISDIGVLYEMAKDLMRLLNIDKLNPDERPVDIEVTNDGLRITLYDRDAHPFFIENTAEYTEWGKFVIENMSWLVGRHSFKIRVDGYVSDGFEGDGLEYSAWELSSDRANATRRYLEYYGVRAQQFESITSHGDKKPLPFIHPEADSNDRVSISLVLSETFNIYDSLVEE